MIDYFCSMYTELGYLALFTTCFLAATVLPFSSEAVYAAMLVAGYDPYLSLSVASIGNWMGGMSSFWIGWIGKWEWIEKYLRIKAEKIAKIHKRIAGKEGWIAFFTWLPGIGDPLAVALGLIKANPAKTAVWMLVGKTMRYVVSGLITLKAIDWLST